MISNKGLVINTHKFYHATIKCETGKGCTGKGSKAEPPPDIKTNNKSSVVKSLIRFTIFWAALRESLSGRFDLAFNSGGGSAYSLPVHPLNLDEKTEIIKSLSLRGASISELNTVRKAISATKGGKLVSKAKCQVVSFILSDIIDSPLDLIASGPTVPNTDPLDAAYTVLQKYNIKIGSNLQRALNAETQRETDHKFNHVYNVLLGNNETALKSVFDDIKGKGKCSPIIMTSSLQGEASVIGRNLARLAFDILGNYDDVINAKFNVFREILNINEESISLLTSTIRNSTSLCLLFGGETTVTVNGKGRGGRNQEMVLAFSLETEKLSEQFNGAGEIAFLSGGTDGIDGPTDAAGALTYFICREGQVIYNRNIWSETNVNELQTDEARKEGLDPEKFLKDNDSYNYFSQLSEGKYLLKPGHTGTNVMDIQMVYIHKY
ncbi:Glycerate kinase [Armadillidium vulgare]|nr:Glycerate kinase [Armadillidium vulgare]